MHKIAKILTLDAALAAWRPYAGDATAQARVAGGDISSLTMRHRVPDAGSTAALALFGFGVMAAPRRFLESAR